MSDSEVDYLQDGFDPWSLTVPRLRSILVAHNIQYPSAAKKPQLVEIFIEQVVPQSRKILNARARVKRMSRGIVDADSQETASTDVMDEDHDLVPPPTVTRSRSPRKSSRVARGSEDINPSQPASRESARKRQSRSVSVQALGASDTDTGPDLDGSRSVRKTRRTTPLTPAVKLEPTREESFFKRTPETETVFSSENPFQSGYSSPPAAAKTPSNRRKTTGPEPSTTKTPSTSRRRTEGPTIAETDHTSLAQRFENLRSKRIVSAPKLSQEPVIEAGEEFTPEAQLELEREEAQNPERALIRKKLQAPARRRTKMTTPIWVLATTLLSAYAAWYRQEKIAVGYCGIGRPATQVIPDNVQLPEWATVLAEPQCEPCPPHAYCYEDFSVRCEQDFILKPHPLSLGGLVPLPPTCEPDGEKVRRVQAVANKAVEELRDRRAKYECNEPVNEEGQTLDSPSIDEQELKQTLSQQRSKRMTAEEFDDLWIHALGEIKARDEVEVQVEELVTGDSVGFPATRLSSTSLARLPLTCAFRRSVKLGLARHRVEIGGLIIMILSALYGRSQFRNHRKMQAQIPGLVDLVLERLAAQKELAFEDGNDDAFLFLPNLRDDVLRATHSLKQRERIWQKVRAVVEQNSNVRTGQRESHNGEVGRAWEWIGASSIGPGTGEVSSARRRKSARVSFGPDVKGAIEDVASTPNTVEKKPVVSNWSEGRPIY